MTLRPVWVRVLVDGERAVERELRGNERIPLRAQRTIAIRAGDAGALRVMIAGQDQGTLGRDGEVVSRTFTVQPARPQPSPIAASVRSRVSTTVFVPRWSSCFLA